MARASGAVVSGLLAGLLVGCAESAPRERVFGSPVPLAEVLALDGVLDFPNACRLSITNARGEPLPYSLLRLEWSGAGRMAFQTDASGSLVMRLHDVPQSSEATLSAESKPLGQDLLERSYDECTEALSDARIVVQVVADAD